MKKSLITLVAAGTPAAALAHPGHAGGDTLGHWLTRPDHLTALALLVLAAGVVVGLWRARHD